MSDTFQDVVAIAPQRLAVSPDEAARLIGVGRTKLYEAIGSGALRSSKIGKRRVITIVALSEWLAALEARPATCGEVSDDQ